MLHHKGVPLVDVSAPTDPTVTAYDERRFPLYIQLLDADVAHVSWEEIAGSVLGLNVKADATAARYTWRSHLARAKWMTEVGYRQLLR